MIDIKRLREAPDQIRAALARRSAEFDPLVTEVLQLDKRRREIIGEVEQLKGERNRSSEEVAQHKRDLAIPQRGIRRRSWT